MFVTIEQKLQFFRDRPDLFLECHDGSDMSNYLNTRDFHIFSCLELTSPFDDLHSNGKYLHPYRYKRTSDITRTRAIPKHGIAFMFSGYNISE
jgi:hypothetical protein